MKVYQTLARCIRYLKEYEEDIKKYPAPPRAIRLKKKYEKNISEVLRCHFFEGRSFLFNTKLDLKNSTEDKLVFNTEYLHMSTSGQDDYFTQHVVTVTPSLILEIKINTSGEENEDLRFIAYKFEECLTEKSIYEPLVKEG